MKKPSQTSSQLTGMGFLLTATLIYSFFGVLSRLIGFQIPLFYLTGLRSLFAALLLVIVLARNKVWKHLNRQELFWVLIRSAFGILAIITFFIAVNFLAIGTVYFIFYAGSTLGGYILGKILFKESLTRIKILSLGLSLFGLCLIYSVAIDSTLTLYAILSLVSGLATAAWNTFPKKIRHHYSAFQLTFLDNFCGAAIALIISLALQEQWTVPNLSMPWGLNALFASLFIATGWLVVNGFRRLAAQIGSLVMLSEALFAVILGFLLYQETIAPLTVVGGVVILFAIILPEYKAVRTLLQPFIRNR